MKKIILMGVISVFALMLAGTLTVECASTLWNLTGSYTIEYTCTSLCSGVWPHTMNITSTDMETGDFSGVGYYNLDHGYTWVVSGNVSDSSLTFKVTYTGKNVGYWVNATGTIAPNGKLSGTASSSSNQTFDWESTTGTATYVPQACPEGSIQKIVWQIGDVEASQMDNPCDEFNYPTIVTGPQNFTVGTTLTSTFPWISRFNKNYAPTINIHFNGEMPSGGVVSFSWSPGASGTETMTVTLDGTTTLGTITRPGTPKPAWWTASTNPNNGYERFIESFDVPPLTAGAHMLTIAFSSGDGSVWDWLKLSECKPAAPDHFLGYKVKTTKVCDGGVTLLTLTNNGPTSNITVTSKDGVVFGPEEVNKGVSFSFGTEGVKLGTNITITSEIEGVVSETTIHTSCSQPIYPGLEFGDFEVVEGESLRGGPLETPAPDFFPCTVELTDQFETGVFTVDKPDKLYNPVDKNGEGINDHNTHLMGYKIKPFGILQHNPPFHECAPCKGGLTSLTLQYNGAQSAQIVVTAGIENEELFTRFISPGDPFSFIGTGTDRKLDKEINIWVDGDLATTIHTSCSQPIGTGQTFGDFKVVAGVSKDGGPICPIIKVESQLETVFVSRDKADRLLVPTAKSLTGPVDPLEETGIDHFKGYKIKAPKLPEDTPKITVTLVDQFDQPKTYIVEKPTRLFVPVDKNGEGIKNPGAHLICYKVKPAEGELKHVKVLGIYTNNQFGWLKLDTHKEEELLVPCMKIIQKD